MKALINGKMYECSLIKGKKVVKPKPDSLMNYWGKIKGFKIIEDSLKYTAKNGKVYNAKKISIEDNNTKQPKTIMVKEVMGGSVWTSKDF